MLKVLLRIALLISASLLVWRILAMGMGAYYTEQARQGDDGSALQALAWNPSEGEMALKRAGSLNEDDQAGRKAVLKQAILKDPTNAGALVALSRVVRSRGDSATADALLDAAAGMDPSDPTIHQAIAVILADQNDPSAALVHLSLAMSVRMSLTSQVFPVLLKIAEDPRLRGLLAPYAVSSTVWWERFFRYVARQALDVDTVRALVAMRRNNTEGRGLTDVERIEYIKRLYMREGLGAEAYLAWVNGLDEVQKGYLGLIYDGGFETEPSGTMFDWSLNSPKGVLIQRSVGYGTDGKPALHLAFRNFDGPFHHVAQWLFLDTGFYRLSGRARPDGLKTSGGLLWMVECWADKQHQLIAETDRFLGSNQWRPFEMEFEIPEGCSRSRVRLGSVKRTRADQRIDGSIWFDDLRLRRLSPPSKGG